MGVGCKRLFKTQSIQLTHKQFGITCTNLILYKNMIDFSHVLFFYVLFLVVIYTLTRYFMNPEDDFRNQNHSLIQTKPIIFLVIITIILIYNL